MHVAAALVPCLTVFYYIKEKKARKEKKKKKKNREENNKKGMNRYSVLRAKRIFFFKVTLYSFWCSSVKYSNEREKKNPLLHANNNNSNFPSFFSFFLYRRLFARRIRSVAHYYIIAHLSHVVARHHDRLYEIIHIIA